MLKLCCALGAVGAAAYTAPLARHRRLALRTPSGPAARAPAPRASSAGRAAPAASFLRSLAAALLHRRPGASVPAAAPRPVRVLGAAGSGSRAAWPRPAVSRSVSRRPAPRPVPTQERPPSDARRCRWRSRGTAPRRQNARRCIEYMSRSSFLICGVQRYGNLELGRGGSQLLCCF